MNDDIDQLIGERVHQALWRAHVTQTDLARALNVDQGSVSRRLRGRIAWKVADLMATGALCGMDWRDLVPEPPLPAAEEGGGAVTRCIPPQPVRLRSVPTPVIAATRRHALSSAQIFGTLPCPA